MGFRFFFFLIAAIFFCVSAQAKVLNYVGVAPSPVHETFIARAETAPRDSYEIQAPRDGVIKEIYMWPGQDVAQDGILAVMDDQDLRQKKTELYAEKNELVMHLQRVEKLMEEGHLSTTTWEKNVDKISRLTAEITILDERIHNSYIRASKRGTVLWSDIKAGENVMGAQPLFWIGDADQMWLTAKVDEALTKGLKKGDQVIILPYGSGDDPPTEHDLIPATIDFVGDKGPKGNEVNIYINGPRHSLESYTEYDVLLPVSAQKSRWVLPESALVDGEYVWSLVPPEATTSQTSLFRTKKVMITPERIEYGTIILDPSRNVGLSTGVDVLIDPPEDMKDHQVVEALPASGNEWIHLYTQNALSSTGDKKCSGGCGGGAGSIPSLCSLAGGVASLIGMESRPGMERKIAQFQTCRIAGDLYENLSPGSFSLDEDVPIPAQKGVSPLPASHPVNQL